MSIRHTFYRCGYCDLNWPYDPEYKSCHKCGTRAAVLSRADVVVMTVAEAISLVNHIDFERYYACESEAAREAQTLAEEQVREQRAAALRERFEAILDGVFTVEEQDRIKAAEQRLPYARRRSP